MEWHDIPSRGLVLEITAEERQLLHHPSTARGARRVAAAFAAGVL